MKEKDVMKIFNKNKKIMLFQMGHKTTTNYQLDEMGKKLFNKLYIGTFPQDKIPFNKILKTKTPKYLIINTDVAGKQGTHWIALYFTPKIAYIFDSYGRTTKELLPVLTKQLQKKNIKIKDSDYDLDQSELSKICGPLCLSFLLTVKQIGIRNSLKI
jgi:hypothetical protein